MNKKYYDNQRGQVLLIAIMLLASVLTVVLAVTFRSTSETQITKLEEESQKALAVAEAGIESALRQGAGTFTIGNLPPGFTGQSTSSTSYDRSTFATPLLQKDEQYTVYFADYDGSTNAFSNYWSGNLDVYLKSETSCPAVELTTIKNDNTMTKSLIDPCNHVSKQAGSDLGTTTGATIEDVSFDYKTSSTIAVSNTKVVVARPLFASTKIGFGGSTTLKPQGKTITSEANSQVGASRVIQLFQSYPQIPADFFVVSF